ncbi:Enoyl reductase (ER) domain-containing protein [Novosphingobium lubricantis]|jgi:hypothetical protein
MLNRQVRVVARAADIPDAGNFEIVVSSVPAAPLDGVVVKVLLTSVDPAMRGWLSNENNYMTVQTGEVMRALGVGEIIASNHPDWTVGDNVYGWLGWQQYAALPPEALFWKVDLSIAPAGAWLGILGLNGLTAWVGLRHLARAKAGETVIVTTAAGAVGGAVGQLAKAWGLTSIGLTGDDDKVKLGLNELGYSAMINYRSVNDLSAAVAESCANGINIFFDNTGGWIADSIFPHLAQSARIIQCGTAATRSWIPHPGGPRREREMLVKRLSWQGFVVFDHADSFPQAFDDLKALYRSEKLQSREHLLDSLDDAPGAIAMLYRGQNKGRLLIRP